jgi:hypothetical protein
MPSRFDEMSKGLAAGMSRRGALRWISGSIAGAALAALGGGKTQAAPDPCAVYCGKTAFVSGPFHAACMQACHTCKGDVSRLCVGPTSVTCCAPGTACRSNGTCVAVPAGCSGIGCASSCGATGSCSCVGTTENTIACVEQVCTFVSCTSSAECGAGAVCFTEGCCGGENFCVPLCA